MRNVKSKNVHVRTREIHSGASDSGQGCAQWPPSRTAAPPGRTKSISLFSEKTPLSVTSGCSQEPLGPITHRDKGCSPQLISLGKLLNPASACRVCFLPWLWLKGSSYCRSATPPTTSHVPQRILKMLVLETHTHLIENQPSLWSLTVYHDKRLV